MKFWHSVDYAKAGTDTTVCQLVKAHRKWAGCWYKPWTWFVWRMIYQYEGGLWVVPAGSRKRVPSKNGDTFYTDRLCEAWQPMKHEEKTDALG